MNNYQQNFDRVVHSKKAEAMDAPIIPDEILTEIENAFGLYDSDGSGLINPQQMLQTFEKMNLQNERPSMYYLIQSMCTPDNIQDGLSYDQFMTLTYAYYSDRYSRDGIKRIFQLFDEENLGVITRNSFKRMADQLEIFLNKDDMDDIFLKASSDGSVISYDDFEFFMRRDDIKN
eukprot:403362156